MDPSQICCLDRAPPVFVGIRCTVMIDSCADA